ncbi:hypothetical protein WISP_141716 [Willisornis vidua]|uniref:Uncharacterized protein n=1 Tax=Willisornis vidua TaxID=1566151 RepID=A0ABQ9CSN8_9PASS|nr:hypothetical protein WISP_141716 [Willisornis vidua]
MPRSVKKEGQEVLQALELRLPYSCGADHGEAAVPLQPMEIHGGTEIHLQPMEIHEGTEIHLQPMEDPMPDQADAQRETVTPTERPCWSRLLTGPLTLRRGAQAGASLLS